MYTISESCWAGIGQFQPKIICFKILPRQEIHEKAKEDLVIELKIFFWIFLSLNHSFWIKFDPICLHLSCFPSNGPAAPLNAGKMDITWSAFIQWCNSTSYWKHTTNYNQIRWAVIYLRLHFSHYLFPH